MTPSGDIKTNVLMTLCSYSHDGTKLIVDSITLSVTDGVNSVTKTIDIDLRSDLRPSFIEGLERRLKVPEGGTVPLSLSNLAATDDVVDAERLTFHVLQQPEFGEVRVDGVPGHRFTQKDLARGAVEYAHTGGEVGQGGVTDLVTLTVTDRELAMDVASPVPLLDLEFDVVPADNSPPRLLVNTPLTISRGQAAPITPTVVSARDPDSPEAALTFVVAQTPMWGFLERAKSTTRSGRSRTSRRVSTFSMSDLRAGAVQYVPSNLSKRGPPSDSFSVYVTDGKNRSPLGHIEVAVVQQSASLPDFDIDDLVVGEGDRAEIGVRVAMDDPKTAERLVVSMAEAPLHGRVVLETGSSMAVEMRDISVADLRTADVGLVYEHDGSESRRDEFSLTLSNGIQIARKTATVTVQAVDDQLPTLVRNEPATVDFGGTITLSDDQLKATDVDTPKDQIYFVVLSRPKRGALQLMNSDRYHDDPESSKSAWIQVFSNVSSPVNFYA